MYASQFHNILEMHASLKCHWFSTKVKMPSFNAFLRELQRRLERVWTKSLLIAHHKIWIYIFLMQKFFTAPKSKCRSKIMSNFINGKTLFCPRLSNSFALFNKPLYLLWGDCWLLCQQDQWYSIFDFWFICFFLPFDEENKRLAFPLLSKKFLSPLTSLVVRAFYVKHSACLLDYLLLFWARSWVSALRSFIRESNFVSVSVMGSDVRVSPSPLTTMLSGFPLAVSSRFCCGISLWGVQV